MPRELMKENLRLHLPLPLQSERMCYQGGPQTSCMIACPTLMFRSSQRKSIRAWDFCVMQAQKPRWMWLGSPKNVFFDDMFFCDVCPEVWMAMLSINGRLGLCALQRLSSLLPSGAPAEEKRQAAAVVCEALTETLAADVKKREHRNKVLLDCIVLGYSLA